ncbi:hypothetical protein Tco_1513054, partial [Tanacetum coccineum]
TYIKEMDIIKAKTDKAEHEKEIVHKSHELSSYGQQKSMDGGAYEDLEASSPGYKEKASFAEQDI